MLSGKDRNYTLRSRLWYPKGIQMSGYQPTHSTGVVKRVSKGKTIYFITYKANGKFHRERVGAYEEGIREAYCRKVRNERLVTPQQKTRTFESVALEYGKLSPHELELHFKAILHIQIKNVQTNDISMLVQSYKEKGNSNGTINRKLIMLSAIFNFAIRNEYTVKNPAKSLGKLKTDNERQGYLTQEEYLTLLNSIADPDALLLAKLLLYTGARVGTICSLRGVDCDMVNRQLMLTNHKATRSYKVSIHPDLVDNLNKKLSTLNNQYDLLLGDAKRHNISRKLQRFLDRLFNKPKQIVHNDRKHRIVTHSLRHTFATNLALKGVSPFVIMKLLDHSSLQMTERYTKVSDEAKREAVNKL